IPHKIIHGEPYALNLNKELIELINTYHKLSSGINREKLAEDNGIIFLNETEVFDAFRAFLKSNGLFEKISIAGKNYLGFDHKFLKKIDGWDGLGWHRRVIDPAPL